MLYPAMVLFALLPAARAQGTNADLNRAQALLAAGKYSEAAAAFTQVIGAAPGSSQAFHGRGMARIDMNDYAGAVLDFDRALALDPKDAVGYNERGYAKMRMGDLNGALPDYDRCIALDPEYEPVHTNRGDLFRSQGNNRAAMQEYDRALQMAPRNLRAREQRASLELAAGDAAGARADLDVAIDVNPKVAGAYTSRGQALEKLGDRAGAISDYQHALALNASLTSIKAHMQALQASVGAAAASVRHPAPNGSGATSSAQSAKKQTTPPVFAGGSPAGPAKQTKAAKASPVTAGEVVALAPPPPPGSPSLAMPASLDIDLVSGTQYAGEVAAAKEAMSAIQGPLSDADQKAFEAKWAPFFNFPATETAGYFKKLNPLLQEYLHLRASVPGIATEMSAAWREAAMLAGYNNEAAVREALGEARVQEQLLQGVNGRMAEIMRQVQALGDPPDAKQAKARVRKHHDDAVALVKKVLPTFTLNPASQAGAPGTACSFTPQANNLPSGAVVRWSFGDGKKADGPVQATGHTFAKEGEFTVTAQLLDGQTQAVIATAAATANITTREVKGAWILQKIDRAVSGTPKSLKAPSPGAPDMYEFDASSGTNSLHYHFYDNKAEAETYDGMAMQGRGLTTTMDLQYEPLPRTYAPGDPLKIQGSFTRTISGSQKTVSPAGAEIYNYPRLDTSPMRIWVWSDPALVPGETDFDIPDPQHFDEKLKSVGFLSARGMPHSVENVSAPYDPNPEGTQTVETDSLIAMDTDKPVELKHVKIVAPPGRLGQGWRVRVRIGGDGMGTPDSAVLMVRETYYYAFQPEGTAPAEVVVNEQAQEETANQQRISELENEVNFIDESISKLQAQRGAARDLASMQSLDYQIIQAQTDRLAETDLIASLKTGQDVHTRSPFDDYAHQTFVANIREQQLRMEEAQRETAALFKFAELGDDRDGMRDQIQRDLIAGGAVARGDITAIRTMANAMNNRVVGYWEGQKAKSEEAAVDADENIFICNTFVMASTMLVSGGMSQLGAVCAAPSWAGTVGTMTYAGVTGYIASGSPAEALKQSIAWSCTVGQVATSMYDGYQDGGGWSGALTGAGTGLAIGWLTGKTSELIVAKWGTGPSFVRPPVRERPPSVGDFLSSAEFRQAQAAGKAKVKAFEDAQAQLQAAGQSGADPERIKALQDAVKARANDINADQHAKMFLLKSGQSSPASIRAYESYHRAIHAEVEAQFHEVMEKEMGFNHQEVAPVRNATSTGSAGMDYDLALKEGNPITRNGKPSSVSEWQRSAKQAYDKAFQQVTGHSAEEAWENVTTSVHAESYKDIGNTPGVFEGWLTDLRNPANVAKLKSKLAQQATDVTRVKAWEFQNNKSMDEFSKMQEICRGTAKDMKTKLDPVLAVAKTSSPADEEALRQARAYWKQVQEVMEDFGSNRIGPITAKQKLYQLTGKESIHEIIDEMGVTMQGAVQWGR